MRKTTLGRGFMVMDWKLYRQAIQKAGTALRSPKSEEYDEVEDIMKQTVSSYVK